MSKDWGFDPLASALARWRSFRQLHRLFLICFVILAIFLIDRYRRVDAEGSLTLPKFGHGPDTDVESGSGSGDGVDPHIDLEAEREAKSIENAGNSTLGFHGIYYINMKARYDREDAAALQAYLSGIEYQNYPAVEADMIIPVGMPPTHRPAILKTGEKGCWRAHANIWSEMVRKKLPPVLIMESDATWDINVREIMSNLNKHFPEFLRKINSTAVHDPSFGSKNNHNLRKRDFVPGDLDPHSTTTNTTAHSAPSPPPITFNPDDPWLSEHWDLLSIGQCFEDSGGKDTSLFVPDPHVPSGRDYWGRKLGHERVIRKSGGIVCTTAYAISHTGAAKLLMRSAIDLDNPVDLLIRRLTRSGDLVAYSVMPPIIAQWEYRGDVGMNERGAQSDINGGPPRDTPKDAEMKGWDTVNQSGSVWQTKGHHHDVAFERMALTVAWKEILGEAKLADSWYNPDEGN